MWNLTNAIKMKRYILYIGWLLCMLTACTDEELVQDGMVGDKEV